MELGSYVTNYLENCYAKNRFVQFSSYEVLVNISRKFFLTKLPLTSSATREPYFPSVALFLVPYGTIGPVIP